MRYKFSPQSISIIIAATLLIFAVGLIYSTKYFYNSINQAQEVTTLQKKTANLRINRKLFDAIIENLKNKKKTKINPQEIKNPFSAYETETE